MTNIWTLGEAKDKAEVYPDGTSVPHRRQDVFLNGLLIGYIEIHMHRHMGSDGKLDTSFGYTAVVYSPPAGGA